MRLRNDVVEIERMELRWEGGKKNLFHCMGSECRGRERAFLLMRGGAEHVMG